MNKKEEQQDFYELGNKEPIFRREFMSPSGMDVQVKINDKIVSYVQDVSFSLTEAKKGVKGIGHIELLHILTKDQCQLMKELYSGNFLGKTSKLELTAVVIWDAEDEEKRDSRTYELFSENVTFRILNYGITTDDIITRYNYTFDILE